MGDQVGGRVGPGCMPISKSRGVDAEVHGTKDQLPIGSWSKKLVVGKDSAFGARRAQNSKPRRRAAAADGALVASAGSWPESAKRWTHGGASKEMHRRSEMCPLPRRQKIQCLPELG